MTSVAKDHILVRHQPLNKITKIQILGCKYFLLYSFNYLDIIFYLYSFICVLLFIFILLIISYRTIIHPRIFIFVILGKRLVSDEDASCSPGVICFFIHYSYAFYSKVTTFSNFEERFIFFEKHLIFQKDQIFLRFEKFYHFSLSNFGISGKISNLFNLGDFGTLGNLGNAGNFGNLGNLGNLENFGNLGNIDNFGNLGNFGNLDNIHMLDNLENLAKTFHVQKREPTAFLAQAQWANVW